MSAIAGILTIILLFVNIGVQPLKADTIEKSFSAAKAVEFSVAGGSVELIGEDTGRIVLEADCQEQFDEHFELVSETVDGVLKIEIKSRKKSSGLFKRFLDFGGSPGLKISLQVPFETECSIRTSGGNVDASSLNAPLSLNTSGGNIKCNNVLGDVLLKTSGGSINCGRIAGTLDAKTSGGNIRLAGCCAETEVKTSGGGIYVDDHIGCLNAKTSGGNIKAAFTTPPCKDCVLKTSGGGITLALPGDADAEIDARTSGGSVSTEIPVNATFPGEQDDDELNGTIGDGGPNIMLRTSGGGIRIKKS